MARTDFASRDIPEAHSLGEVLRAVRQHRGYKPEEVASRLMVSRDVIVALERDQLDKLPPQVYMQGILRRYAALLRFDERAVIDLYKRDLSIYEKVGHKEAKILPKRQKKQFIFVTPTVIKWTAVVLAVLFGAAYIFYQLSSFSDAPTVALAQPVSDAEINQSDLVVLGTVTGGATLTINGQEVLVDEQGNFRENIVLQNGDNVIEVRAKNKLGKTTVVTRHVVVKNAGLPTTAQEGGLVLTASIQREATWVQVVADDQTIFTGTMLAGSSRTFQAERSLVVSAGRANKVLISFNGTNLGSLGSTDTIIRDVRFDRSTTSLPK